MQFFQAIYTLDDLKKTYHELARQYHPDINKHADQRIMQTINAEYEKLLAYFMREEKERLAREKAQREAEEKARQEEERLAREKAERERQKEAMKRREKYMQIYKYSVTRHQLHLPLNWNIAK